MKSRTLSLSLVALLALLLALSGCANSKALNGKVYEPYGLANQERRDPHVVYTIPAGNWVCGIAFSESILIPGYIILFDLYEPSRLVEDQKEVHQ